MIGFLVMMFFAFGIAAWFVNAAKANFANVDAMTVSEEAMFFAVPFVAPIICYALSETVAGMIAAIVFAVGIAIATIFMVKGYLLEKIALLILLMFSGIAKSSRTMLGNVSIGGVIYFLSMIALIIVVVCLSTDWDTPVVNLTDQDKRNIKIAAIALAIGVLALFFIGMSI